MITEGTAEYARIQFEKWREEQSREKTTYGVPDLSDDETGKNVLMNIMGKNVYGKGLEIVKGTVTSLPETLVPEIRERMEKLFLGYLDTWTAERVDKNDTPYDQRATLTRMLLPEFNVLDQGLTQNNLLVALRAVGLTRMLQNYSIRIVLKS